MATENPYHPQPDESDAAGVQVDIFIG